MRLKNFFCFGGISNDRGHSIVEFALVAPLMILMALGATDFSRVFHDAETVVSAANSGSVYGIRRIIDSVDDSEIQARALSDTFGTEAASVDSTTFCDCPDSPGTPVSCLTGTCPFYGSPRVYVKTTVTKTFKTLGRYPGVPSSTPLRGVAYLRVQ